MDADDRREFGCLLAALGETFNESVSPTRAAVYWDALGDLPLATVRAAVREVLRSALFFPKPAEIRMPAEALLGEARLLLAAPSHLAEAITAAGAVKAAVDRRQAAADAEAARVAALSPAERAAAAEAARDAERRRVEAWHALWAEQDRARQFHTRPRRTETRPDDPTVQRCPRCNSFRIIPDVGGAIWRCARCKTVCET